MSLEKDHSIYMKGYRQALDDIVAKCYDETKEGRSKSISRKRIKEIAEKMKREKRDE